MKPSSKHIRNYRDRHTEKYAPPMESVSTLMSKVFLDLNLDTKIKDYELMQYWSIFCEQELSVSVAKATKASHIDKDRKLVIKVKSAVINSELKLQHKSIEQRFLDSIKGHESQIKGLNFA